MEPGLPAVVALEQEEEEAEVAAQVAAEVVAGWVAQGLEPDLVATAFVLNADRQLLTSQAFPATT
jgi:hypothetical protein